MKCLLISFSSSSLLLLSSLISNTATGMISLFLFIYFIFGRAGSSLPHTSSLQLWCTGFSLQWLLLLRSTGSRSVGFSNCSSWALEPWLSSCSAQALLLHGMWDPPGPGMEPMCPVLAGKFLVFFVCFFFFSLIYFFYLEDNCFTILCWFGREVQERGGITYTYGWFMLLYSRWILNH